MIQDFINVWSTSKTFRNLMVILSILIVLGLGILIGIQIAPPERVIKQYMPIILEPDMRLFFNLRMLRKMIWRC